MKSLFLPLTLLFCLSALGEEAFRTWESKAGSQLEAKVTKFSKNKVTLEKKSGKKLHLNFNQLSEKDQNFLKRHSLNTDLDSKFAPPLLHDLQSQIAFYSLTEEPPKKAITTPVGLWEYTDGHLSYIEQKNDNHNGIAAFAENKNPLVVQAELRLSPPKDGSPPLANPMGGFLIDGKHPENGAKHLLRVHVSSTNVWMRSDKGNITKKLDFNKPYDSEDWIPVTMEFSKNIFLIQVDGEKCAIEHDGLQDSEQFFYKFLCRGSAQFRNLRYFEASQKEKIDTLKKRVLR